MNGRCVGQSRWQSGCRGHVPGQPVLRNHPRNTASCRASQQAVASNGTITSVEPPAKFEGNAVDVQSANLNACVEFLKEELPRIFKTGVCIHTRTTLQLLRAFCSSKKGMLWLLVGLSQIAVALNVWLIPAGGSKRPLRPFYKIQRSNFKLQ